MIGVFDSGLGGLTVLRVLAERFPQQQFVYLGDHANVPYGNRSNAEVLALTCAGVESLFAAGCRLVLLGCNTATAVAARYIQQVWLPERPWKADGRNVLGIIAPTVERATQTPWAITSPQYPQKFNDDIIVVFGTARTIDSMVYPEEIGKRCPQIRVIPVRCPGLAGAIEADAGEAVCDGLVEDACREAIATSEAECGRLPNSAILGCTHYPIVEHLFRRHLPPSSRLVSQPRIVADSLEDYLARHPQFATAGDSEHTLLTTTGDVATVDAGARVFWSAAPSFRKVVIADGRR